MTDLRHLDAKEAADGAPELDDFSQLSILRDAAQNRQRYLERAVARQADVDAKPDAQPWEIEHARRTVIEATVAVESYALAIATAEGSAR